jgi:hypothetical protein
MSYHFSMGLLRTLVNTILKKFVKTNENSAD